MKNKKALQPSSKAAHKNLTGKSRQKAILIVLLVAVGIFVTWKLWFRTAEGDTAYELHGMEETLVAANPILQLLESAETGIDFQNLITESAENNITTNINMYNGGGVAVADVNNDQLPDIYFICSSGKNRLYLNEGNFKFKDITDSAGMASEEGFETAVVAVDINTDGFMDFYVCRGGPKENEIRRNKLFINNGISSNGNITFTERSREYKLDDISASSGAAFFDGDGDGDLDCYVLNYPTDLTYASKIDVKMGPNGKPTPSITPKREHDTDRYYRNDGPPLAGKGGFTDVSKESGIWNFSFGLSVSVSDINRDGHPDIYVGNDFIQPDQLYINSGRGVFTNRLAEYVRHTSQSTMGTDLSDFDNDGYVDIFTTDMLPATNNRHKTLQTTNTLSRYLSTVQNGYFEPVIRNVLQHNNGNGTFSDVACLAGVYKTDWSWSGLVADYDNDGHRDIYVSNGYRRDIVNRDYMEFLSNELDKMSQKELQDKYTNLEGMLNAIPTYKIRDFLFQNKGNWQFEDKGGQWATMKATWSCGGAWADLDADGDLDLVISNLEDPSFIFKNLSREQNKGNYLQAKLHGSPSNPFAVGASVLIEYANGQKQFQEVNPNRGTFSCSEHLVHFGLGQVQEIQQFSVRWPDGKVEVINNLPVNQRLQLDWKNAKGYVASLMPSAVEQTLMSDKTVSSGANFVHKENKYNDFENFPLNPWMESELGPLITKGDANGDGLDDFFIGSTFNSPAALYLQTTDGHFREVSQSTWEADKIYEDHGAIFFDFDMDGDQDLYVVSGGTEAVASQAKIAWQNRLYINTDGKGTYARVAPSSLPDISSVGLRVAAHDFDKDGYLDLFIGGRVTPGKWPLTPPSYVLRNDRNRLTDVTQSIGGDFARCGMVTDLAWADVDNDGQEELIVVGEWMPVSIFKLKDYKLVNVSSGFGLDKSNGLWFRLALQDIDKDGDLDLITGNFGLNSRFTAGPETPFGCYAWDFDNNGTLDPVVTMYEGKNNYPLVQKDVLVKQMPALKKRFLYASQFANVTIDQIWPKEDLDKALHLVAYDLETCLWENRQGKFVRRALPIQAQMCAIQGIVADDLNGDGNVDLLMAGNKYNLEVESGRYDAGIGVFLAGDGKGNFTWVSNLQSGFWAPREARDLTMLKAANNKRIFIVGNNNSALQVFQ